MGLFGVDIRVAHPDGTEARTVDALVDTGALYTTVPGSMLKEIGVEPKETRAFELADGSTVEFELGSAIVSINGRQALTVVAFGPEDTEPLLGAMALQQMELAIDMSGEMLVDGRRLRM
ncbi:MAG: clan AA aspartic protease [Chloroflexi bacterium]|nr:clan AA aspartic protease [Chloroflexota bacterium]